MISIPDFHKEIRSFYRKHGRHDLPWRHTRDPYKIFISEVMLQQTQVARVIPKYLHFVKLFPTVGALARVPQEEVLRVWQGLGYNRRALYMQKAAQRVVNEYKGKFPKEPRFLEDLPGIGHYTARAIAAFAWDGQDAFLETNIRRVYIHFFFSGRTVVFDKDILKHIEKTMPKRNIRDWFYALMDYGAIALKDIPNPNRKSKGYSKQSRFHGSRRFARAKLLALMLESRRMRRDTIKGFFKNTPELRQFDVDEIIQSLEKDGFIRRAGASWVI